MPFEDINGLLAKVQSGAYQVVLDGNSMSRTNMIKQSQTEVYTKLKVELFGPKGDQFRKVKYIKGLDGCVDFVKKNAGYVFFGPRDALDVKALTDCDVTVLPKGLLPVEFSIPLQKNSPYATIFSEKIRELHERGFIAKWLNDYKVKKAASAENRILKCDTAKDRRQSKDRLTLDQSQGAFWVLLIGVGVSAAAFGIERLFGLTQLL
uniref:Uncharacterized protein n=1 Tax=Plectus sambesii TaxID=2011161 RepID=A0A914V7Z3_9BILA